MLKRPHEGNFTVESDRGFMQLPLLTCAADAMRSFRVPQPCRTRNGGAGQLANGGVGWGVGVGGKGGTSTCAVRVPASGLPAHTYRAPWRLGPLAS